MTPYQQAIRDLAAAAAEQRRLIQART